MEVNMASLSNVFCTQCGKQNMISSKFCFRCGSKLQKQEMSAVSDGIEQEEAKETFTQPSVVRQIENAKNLSNGFNTPGKSTRMKSFFSQGDYGFGAVDQANQWLTQNPNVTVLDIQHFVHPVVKFYVWVTVTYTM